MSLRIRRGTEAQRTGVTFDTGELVYTTDTKQLWIGDGVTAGGSPIVGSNITGYGLTFNASSKRIEVAGLTADDITNGVNNKFFSTDLAQDAAAALFAAGSHTNITFQYDDTLNKINATVTLDGIGLTDIVNDTSPSLGGNLDLNAKDITGTGNINITGNINVIGSIFGDDSVLLVNGVQGRIVGPVFNNTVSTETAIVTELTINQRGPTDDARKPAIEMYSQSNGMFDGPFIQMIGYRGSRGVGQQPLEVGDTAGQIRFSSSNIGIDENRPIPAIINAIITEVGDNVTAFTQAKLQIVLLSGPDILDASVTEISKGGVLSTPVLQTGVYANATVRDAHFTDRSISPTAGMIIFLTSTSKFQGFDGSNWTDLN